MFESGLNFQPTAERQRCPSYQPSPVCWELGRRCQSAEGALHWLSDLVMGEWFAGRMWSEHPRAAIFGKLAAPLALGLLLGPLTGGLPQSDIGRAFGPC